jgi:hypothetical protein
MKAVSMLWDALYSRLVLSPARETKLLRDASATLDAQRKLLLEAGATILQWQDLALTAQRSARDLAIAFRISVEKPEVDLRDELDSLIQALSDSVAQLEEHLPIS